VVRVRTPSDGDVLLTGATGFLGTALLARLVGPPHERRVWALVRARDDAQAAERIRLALAPLVDDLDAACERVVAVAADLQQPWMGLDERQCEAIARWVTDVIHSAASVSFSLPLEEARAINVDGTRRVLDLAVRCAASGDGLRRFAHVSTAYVAGTHRGVFGEDDHDVGQGFNNTYEQTKWEAEQLVRAHAERLPVQVLRPSIVVGDHETGWTASFNVLYTPLRAYARGALSVIPAIRSAPFDAVPVSFVADAIAELALGDGGECRTYHLTASERASTMDELIALSARRCGRPPLRTIRPALYRRAVHPLLLARSSGATRRWLQRADVFFPYLASRVRFDASRTRAAISTRPAPLRAYFDTLVDYAESVDWGRAPEPVEAARRAIQRSAGYSPSVAFGSRPA
jgi:long-chain acyl-CoA synthetase